MSEKTPGQAAYEAYYAPIAGPLAMPDSWDMQPSGIRDAWNAAAQAAVDAAVRRGTLDAGQAPYEAYCEASDGKSLISGAPLPAWDEQADEIKHAWNHAAFTAAGVALQALWDLRAERDELREKLADAVNPTAEDYDNAAEILRLRDDLDEATRWMLDLGSPALAARARAIRKRTGLES